MDEEKKVEAVREFYANAAENKTAFASAERMLFFGQFSFPVLIWAISDFSPSWGALLHPSVQCSLLGIWAHDVHDNQLIFMEFLLGKYFVSALAKPCGKFEGSTLLWKLHQVLHFRLKLHLYLYLFTELHQLIEGFYSQLAHVAKHQHVVVVFMQI